MANIELKTTNGSVILGAQDGTGEQSVQIPRGTLAYEENLKTIDGKSLVGTSNIITLPTGSVIYIASNTTPIGYIDCAGYELSRTTYSDLFSVIGTTYGIGDGSTTFNIPNISGDLTYYIKY